VTEQWPVADPEPRIISLLRTLLDLGNCAPPVEQEHARKALAEIVSKWDKQEDLTQLRRELGVGPQKKRRKNSTVAREESITIAIVNAALRGQQKPKDVAAVQFDADIKEVDRAWKKWRFLRIRTLESILNHESFGPAAQAAQAALTILRGQ
jgi:hypothetical protein